MQTIFIHIYLPSEAEYYTLIYMFTGNIRNVVAVCRLSIAIYMYIGTDISFWYAICSYIYVWFYIPILRSTYVLWFRLLYDNHIASFFPIFFSSYIYLHICAEVHIICVKHTLANEQNSKLLEDYTFEIMKVYEIIGNF